MFSFFSNDYWWPANNRIIIIQLSTRQNKFDVHAGLLVNNLIDTHTHTYLIRTNQQLCNDKNRRKLDCPTVHGVILFYLIVNEIVIQQIIIEMAAEFGPFDRQSQGRRRSAMNLQISIQIHFKTYIRLNFKQVYLNWVKKLFSRLQNSMNVRQCIYSDVGINKHGACASESAVFLSRKER